MSSQQKRGFRLPWATEPAPEEGAGTATLDPESIDATNDVERDDLGDGPFHLAGASPTLTTDPAPAESDSILVTVILRHQQDKNLSEIRRILEAQGFWDQFPPRDARVVSWNLVMGVGHIIVLKIPAGAVRRLNLAIENGAWGAFDTEIYLTYDYQAVWRDYIEKREEAREDLEDGGN